MRLLAAMGILAVLASCSPTIPQPNVAKLRGAISGRLQPIDYFYYVNADCSSTGTAQIRVLKAPDNGTLTIEPGQEPIAFRNDNAQAVCNGKLTPATFLRYQSKPGYVGSDSMEIDIIGPYGADHIIQYTLTIHPAS